MVQGVFKLLFTPRQLLFVNSSHVLRVRHRF